MKLLLKYMAIICSRDLGTYEQKAVLGGFRIIEDSFRVSLMELIERNEEELYSIIAKKKIENNYILFLSDYLRWDSYNHATRLEFDTIKDTRNGIENIIQFYETNQQQPFVSVTPLTKPGNINKLLSELELHESSRSTVMILGEESYLEQPKGQVKVLDVSDENIEDFLNVSNIGFELVPDEFEGYSKINTLYNNDHRVKSFCAYKEQNPVGAVSFYLNNKVGVVYNLCTIKEFRNQGIATALLASIISRFWKSNICEILYLVTRSSRAKNLYERVGFETFYERSFWTK